MKSLTSIHKRIGTPLLVIMGAGALIRIIFLQFLAPFYFGRENFYVDGDTYAWCYAFQNLIEIGSFSVNPGLEYGYFGRMPGYSFFVGIFYLLTGQNWETAFPFIAWVQLILDVISIWLVYRIMKKVSANQLSAQIAAALYAFYPFIIVWIPVVYSEQTSIFFLLWSVWFLLQTEWKYTFFGAVFLGISALLRPQMLVLAPFLMLFSVLKEPFSYWKFIKKGLILIAGFLLVYAPWPLRNYINHDKVIFTQDIRGFYNWNVDALAFYSYIYVVKSEWEPQYSQIIHNQRVEWPEIAYLNPEDSLKLEHVIRLCQTCGSGFSHKFGYWKESFDEPNCNPEIVRLFSELRDNQIRHNPLNVYVWVPLMNLKKALFKTQLTDSASLARKAASLLFYYRSFLILCGWIGLVLVLKRKNTPGKLFYGMIAAFFLAIYLLLCAGLGIQMRNIEMRYFLPADILLLFPAAYLFSLILEYRMNKALTKKGVAGIL